jgi:phospholipid/cholesterol/gamma-HCH transport system substrate-binding protein
METRAPYALIGLFVLAAIGAVFGFVFWLHNTGGLGERAVYRIRFENTVSGLLTGAAVLFNGIKVGEVTDLRLDPGHPRQVLATVAVVAATPVRADTQVGLEYQGLTGVPVVSMLGGSAGTRLTPPSPGEPPVLAADPAAGQSMTESARQALRRLDALLADNSEPLKSAIANLNTFTGALARNSDRVDTILAGLEKTMGGGAAKAAAPTYYDLTAPRAFPPAEKAPKAQLIVADPTVLVALDTQRIIVAPGAGEAPAVEAGQWSDTIPKMVQARVVQSFENAKYVAAVAKPMEGLAADYQLVIDIRSFGIAPGAPGIAAGSPLPVAKVEFSAKVVADGRIVASRTFSAASPAPDVHAAPAAAAIDTAFGKAATELVVWAGSVI